MDFVLQRLRDPQSGTHSRTFVRPLLSRLQAMTNLALQSVVETATLATEPHRQVYPVAPLLPRAGRIVGVQEAGRDLDAVPWATLRYVDGAWFRATADRFEVWSRVGPDFLVVHPAKRVASSVTV